MSDAICMKKITKIYPNGTIANKNVDFILKKGEIHALLGENGAGKSTLMNILFGVHKMTYGDVFVNGNKVDINSPMEALEHRIGMVHQHFMLVPSMTIAENLILGSENAKRGIVNLEDKIKEANIFARKYNFNIDCSKKIQDVTVGVRQKVEILKALYRGAEILILDEPTAVLTPQETEELFVEIKSLRDKGTSIVFISHKLKEVKELCARMTIMRHGMSVGVYDVTSLNEEQISEKMVGREVFLSFDKPDVIVGKSKLKVRDLTYINEFGKKVVNNVSFDVRAGEILGVAGVDGNGQSELVESIVGLNKRYTGKVIVDSKLTTDLSIKEIRNLGMRFISEDRLKDGCVKETSIYNNLCFDKLEAGHFMKNRFMIDYEAMKEFARRKVKEYEIKCNSVEEDMGSLSGGNMQKVIVAREFDGKPDLIIVNQPTRGIDVGAAELIRKKLIELRSNGSAILLLSADLNEVLEVSDKLIVMSEGSIAAYFEEPKSVSEMDLGTYMLGVKKQDDVSGVIHE